VSGHQLSRRRSIAVWVLIVLAALIGFVSALTVWVKRQALETDKWVATSSRLLEDPEIRQALSVYMVDQLYENVDVAAELQQKLPPDVKPLAGPLAGGLRELSVRAADTLLARPGVQELWREANRRAHEALINLVEGGSSRLQTTNGDVVLDLRPLIEQLGAQLGLGARFQERLGPDAGRIVILHSDQLSAAQTGVKIIRALSVFLAIAVVALFALAVYLARGRRRETLRNVGTTFVVVGVLLLVVRKIAGNWIVDTLTNNQTAEAPARRTWLIGTDLLAGVAWTAIIYGLIVMAAAILAGPTRAATWVRLHLAPTMRERPGLVFSVVGLVYLLVVLWGPTPAFRNVLWIIVFAGLIALGTEAFRRLTVREFPPGAVKPAP
jgi:hypothetical protein